MGREKSWGFSGGKTEAVEIKSMGEMECLGDGTCPCWVGSCGSVSWFNLGDTLKNLS